MEFSADKGEQPQKIDHLILAPFAGGTSKIENPESGKVLGLNEDSTSTPIFR